MTRVRFKSCFISAPFGVDTSIIRQALEEKGIRWWDQTKMGPGASWLDALDDALARADFVCAVLTAESHTVNIFFELGVAYAKHKPILAFLKSPLAIPSDIYSLTYVRADPTDREAVRSALYTFLEHADVKASPRRLQRPIKPKLKPQGPLSVVPPSNAVELEQRTASLLQKAGFIVSTPTERRDEGADLAVWIDELQHSLGNPLLVELKMGDLSPGRLEQAAGQLRYYIAKLHGSCGLLVYLDRENREFAQVSAEWPLVFKFSFPRFVSLVTEGRLVNELIRLRNAAIHGKV